MIRVVVTGSECTGKTTLAMELAEHYGTVWVPEFVRQFVEAKGSAPEYADVEAIARGQIALEDRMTAKAAEVLIQDTDLLSTVVYSQHYYGDCPRWIEEELRARAGDLYLLACIDVPWSRTATNAIAATGAKRCTVSSVPPSSIAASNFVELHGFSSRTVEHGTITDHRGCSLSNPDVVG